MTATGPSLSEDELGMDGFSKLMKLKGELFDIVISAVSNLESSDWRESWTA